MSLLVSNSPSLIKQRKMENFLSFSKFLWKFTRLDQILVENRGNLKQKFIFFAILVNIFILILPMFSITFARPFNMENMANSLIPITITFITLFQLTVLFIKREKLHEIFKKIPNVLKSHQEIKFTSLVRRTQFSYGIYAFWGAVGCIFFFLKSVSSENLQFADGYAFPFEISNPIIFYLINFDMLVVMLIFQAYFATMQVLKFGMIAVTSIEFEELSEEIKVRN